MKKFLAIYLGSSSGAAMKEWNSLDEESKKARQNAGMTAWMEWAKQNESHITGQGSPLGKTKRINGDGISDVTNMMAAYAIVKADSHEEAAKLFINHPHFAIFPGDCVEVMECLPLPSL